MVTIAELLHDKQDCRQRGSKQNKRQFSTLSAEELLTFINGEVPSAKDSFLCLVIHNIDGPAVRDSDSQQLLARIADCFNVRVVASIDHVNAPLLWDKKMAHVQFNWCWHHTPTFAPYAAEGALYPPILTSGTAAQCARTAAIVLRSLTPNAQGVFKIIAEYQLANEKEEGIPASTLYTNCRERFLVSSQAALNSHLTEFKDHGLVKTKKHSDGQDCIHVPLSSDAMMKLVSDLGADF